MSTATTTGVGTTITVATEATAAETTVVAAVAMTKLVSE